MEHVATDHSIKLVTMENFPMKNTNLDEMPHGVDSIDPIACPLFTGFDEVATPDGESANDTHRQPSFPDHGTQPARLLAALLQNEQLTHKAAWEILGISRLAAVAHTLRRDFGWSVKNSGLRAINRFGEDSKVGLYKLNSADIAWAGDRGSRYAHIEYARMASLDAITKHKKGTY